MSDYFVPDGWYRYSLTKEIAICYEDEKRLTNPKEIPIGSKQRHGVSQEWKFIGSTELATEVFCPYHRRWEWKGEGIHWKRFATNDTLEELATISVGNN